MAEPIIRIEHVSYTYGDAEEAKEPALRDVTLDIRPGELFQFDDFFLFRRKFCRCCHCCICSGFCCRRSRCGITCSGRSCTLRTAACCRQAQDHCACN